ncbi:MAG: exodeoxyribonuclease VII small subunit [PVC group bacterium]
MAEIKFDQALQRLEKLVEEMEEEELPLEKSLEKYEEGTRLARLCLEKLNQAESKIELLKKTDGPEPETEPFAGNGEPAPGDDGREEELPLG